MKTLWQSLENEINRRGIEAVADDVERAAEQFVDNIVKIIGAAPMEGSEPRDLQLGNSRVSRIICITNELSDAIASARRGAKIARALRIQPCAAASAQNDEE